MVLPASEPLEVAGAEKILKPQVGLRRPRWADAVDSDRDGLSDDALSTTDGDTRDLHSQGDLEDDASDCSHLRGRGSGAGRLRADAAEFVPTANSQFDFVGIVVLGPRMDNTDSATEGARGRRRRNKTMGQWLHTESQLGVVPEVPEETWRHRGQQRRKELATLEARVRALSLGVCDQDCCVDDVDAARPDPEDRSMSRRQWKRAVDAWFKMLLGKYCPESGRTTAASIDETQPFATRATSCDGGATRND
mmetsp:Transcript_16579/g.33624  ORF Transcript_16579/g.33624 Transcript_16579/m.33624 type:complete len:250 (+) Transcript_16579:59-808(+)